MKSKSYNGGQMSSGQFQESFQMGAFYSRHDYYDPGSALITLPLPLPQAMLKARKLKLTLILLSYCLSNHPSSTLFGGEGGNWSESCSYHVHCPNTFSPHCLRLTWREGITITLYLIMKTCEIFYHAIENVILL